MSWGIVKTNAGPLLLAIGRDITVRRHAESRQRRVAMLGERALAGADAASLAAEAVDLLRSTLPVVGAEVRLAGGGALAASGPVAEPGMRVPIGTGDALMIAPGRQLGDEEVSLVRAVANTLATALERLRGDERVRYEAVHDPADRPREPHAAARPPRARAGQVHAPAGSDRGPVRRHRCLQAGQ